jgi:hypothetical protein
MFFFNSAHVIAFLLCLIKYGGIAPPITSFTEAE